jgi:hypothetical protein
MENALVLVQVFYKLSDSAFVKELVRFLGALIVYADANTRVQKRFLAQPLRESVKVESVTSNISYRA